MISLELAQALRDAGLKWECLMKTGDWYEVVWKGKGVEIWNTCKRLPIFDDQDQSNVWLPELSDLFTEIEKRGYGWTLSPHYALIRWWDSNDRLLEKQFTADTTEDAAGKALLWILKEGQDG